MLTRSFEREGHRVTAVGDGETALDAAAERSYDIVLLDVALGAGPTGYDVARMLRSRRDVVPIIMLPRWTARRTPSRGWKRALMTTSPNRSGSPSCARASAPCSGAPRAAWSRATC